MLIAGILLFVGGCVLLVFSNRSRAKADAMTAVETTTVGQIDELVAEIRADLGDESPSGYSDYCEFKGDITCEDPLIGELSGKALAIMDTRVSRILETRREETDDDGHVRTTWTKSTETLSHNRQTSPFFLDDGTGKIQVRPPKSGVELVELVDRFEPPTTVEARAGHLSLGVGSFSLSVPVFRPGSSRRLVGYQFTEKGLLVGRRAYAIGRVEDTADGLVLGPTQDAAQPFVLSLRSEEELVAASQKSAKWLAIGGYASTAIGVGLVLFDIVQ